MNKKLRLFSLLILGAFLLSTKPVLAQNTCGTGAPSQQWEEWFTKEVAKYIENQKKGKSQIVNHTIPVVFHIIHFGELIPNYPNIDSMQIKSQIDILNQDFGGVGYNVNNVPSYFANLVSNTGIQFCLAAKDPNDVILLERGTNRKSAAANNWTSPATATLNLKSYFQSVIMPATIWDPTKYLNVWVSDKPPGYPLNAFATYPTGSGQAGLFGSDFGTSTTDGIWLWAKAIGNIGSATAPTHKGRTLTHEVGHYLGLRHIWGDGNCLSDYVNDTPWAKYPHYGCDTLTPPNLCGVNQSPNGEMPMNFMDRSDDECMYMFTHDQNVRMQVALSQAPNRNLLGTHNKCPIIYPPGTASAVANFNLASAQCLNQMFFPFNTSTGNPSPTYVWSSSPAASFGPTSTQPNPGITITTPGTYTITLVATNSLSSSTHTQVVTATSTCAAAPLCLDSIQMIKNVDTLYNYKVANNNTAVGCLTGFAGYLTGNNCYKDKEFAQFYPPVSYTSNVQNPQVNSVIVLFDTAGTKANNPATQITCRVYGGSSGTGPVNPIGLAKSDSLGKIVATANVSSVNYIGKPNFMTLNHKIIPFRFDFVTPIIVNANSGFYVSVNVPSTSGDSINIFSNTKYNSAIDSSAWYLNFNGNWRTFKHNRSAKIQLAIIPQITCSPIVGIREEMPAFSSNIQIMPNPANGLFSLIFTLSKEQDITVRISDSMGQLITEEQFKNISGNAIDIDLTTKPAGVYFVELSNGLQKTVKKVVINH